MHVCVPPSSRDEPWWRICECVMEFPPKCLRCAPNNSANFAAAGLTKACTFCIGNSSYAFLSPVEKWTGSGPDYYGGEWANEMLQGD